MSKREDVLRVLRGENPEYVPWFGDLAYWIEYLLDDGLMDKKYMDEEFGDTGPDEYRMGIAIPFTGEGLHRLHHDLGVGFYLQGYFPFSETCEAAPGIEYRGDDKIITHVTPAGTLREVWFHERNTHSWAPKERMVKDWRDLAALRWIYEHTEYAPDYLLAEQRVERVGDEGIVVVYTMRTPLQELIAQKAGIEAVTYMYMDAQDELEETLAVMEAKHDETARLACAAPGDCVLVPDNLSSDISSGMFYEKYLKGVHEKWVKMIRGAGKYSMVHLDGALDPLAGELSKSGFDVIEAVTPAPVGDLALPDLKGRVLPETVLWGGIPGGFFHPYLSDGDFERYVIETIECMKGDNRFVLAVGDQIVPESSPERIRRVDELVKKYGKYD